MFVGVRRVEFIYGFCLLIISDVLCKGKKSYSVYQMTNNCMCEDVSSMDHQCRCRGADFVDIPQNLTKSLSILSIQDAGLEVLKSESLIKYAETLHELNLINLDKFYHIETGVFRNLVQFQTLYIYSAPRLKRILPEVFTAYLPKFKVLRIMYTGLRHVPNLNGLNSSSALNMVDLDHNKIRKISARDFNGIAISQLTLSYNEIETVEEDAFMDSQIASIALRGNTKLTVLHKKAFRKLQDLRTIDLSDTSITTLPTEGLQGIDILKIEDSYSLKVFPSVYNFKNIKEAWLTYPYHCCAFMYPTTHDEYEKHIRGLLQLQQACLRNQSTSVNSNPIDYYQIPKFPSCTNSESMWHEEVDQIFVKHDCDISHEVFCQDFKEVLCYPKPDPFNPCEDLMGNWGLRVPVWIIAHSAAIGNLFVLIVIATSHFRLTVSKFLMCNLAIADLCIGIHLLLLAGIDAHSIGAYFNFAIEWQEGYGCNVAGFLTTFGNVLSVYTLAIITLERWCTITWAAHLHKRLKMRTSVKIMIIGWIAAIVMASLPLQGISSYARTSICLPLEYKNSWDAVYLGALLMFNCSAFTIICVCYGSMYRTIKSGTKSGIANSARNDQTVAKKMALLVFTDFACLSPIAFFGFTALLGYPLITVTQTKILLVFVYPLNSCANPCLYAILTQQYRKDFFILLGRLGLCKEYAQYNRGAIRGRPLPYTTKFQKPHGMIRSVSSKSNNSQVNRNSLVTTVSNVNVEIPLMSSSGRCRDNECSKKQVEFNSVNL